MIDNERKRERERKKVVIFEIEKIINYTEKKSKREREERTQQQ